MEKLSWQKMASMCQTLYQLQLAIGIFMCTIDTANKKTNDGENLKFDM